MDIYDQIYKKLNKLIPDIKDLNPGDYRKSKSGGFMDLNLDVLDKSKDMIEIALSHNFEMNGDLVPDPDMQIRIYLIEGWEKAEALTYQDQYGYREVYKTNDDGQKLVSLSAKKELNSFLNQWLKNALDQGHLLKN